MSNNFTTGLRALADFLDDHPEIPCPPQHVVNIWLPTKTAKDQLATIARRGAWTKHYVSEYFYLGHSFAGNIALEVNAHREAICERIVTGVQELPAQPARTIEIVEWRCSDDPLLKAPTAAPHGLGAVGK